MVYFLQTNQEPMEGDCKMESEPIKCYNKTIQTQNDCRDICDDEPRCKYYVYDKDWTCTIYPDTKRRCISFIGAANRAKCNLGDCLNSICN